MAGKHRLLVDGQQTWFSSSAGYARHVGRVGALAVALGIGTAMGNGIGVANADEPSGPSTVDRDRTEQHRPSVRIGDAPRRRAVPGLDARRSDTDEAADRATSKPGRDRVFGKPRAGSDQPEEDSAPRLRIRLGSTEELSGRIHDVIDNAVEHAQAAHIPDIAIAAERMGLRDKIIRPNSDLDVATTEPDADETPPRRSLPAELNQRFHDVIEPPLHVQDPPTVDRAGLTIPASRTSASVETLDAVASAKVATASTQAPTFLSRLQAAVGLGGLASPPTPSTPGEPALLTLLNWVRRQFESTFDNVTPTITPSLETPVGRVVTGALNPADFDLEPDRLGQLTYTASGLDPGARVDINQADGTFIYTAPPGYEAVNDEITITVSDADTGWHIHGLAGLLNAVTFGLLGDAGHTSTQTVTVQIAADYPPEVVGDGYVIDSTEPDPVTGAITGHMTVTDDHPGTLTYHVAPGAGPDPTVGELELNGTTVEWTFTPTPAARVAALTTPQPFTFAVVATDGFHPTGPIQVAGNVSGVSVAAIPLPAGAQLYSPTTSNPNNGDAYQVSYDPSTGHSYLTVIHPDGSYTISEPDALPGQPIYSHPPVIVDSTAYVYTYIVTPGGTQYSPPSYQTYITTISADGIITAPDVADALPGADLGGPITMGDSTFQIMYDSLTDKTYFAKLDAAGGYTQPDLATEGIPGAAYYGNAFFTVGGTTYLLTQSSANQGHTYATVIGLNGEYTAPDPADAIPGNMTGGMPLTDGGNAYLVTTRQPNTGPVSYVTVFGPDGFTPPDEVDDAVSGYAYTLMVIGNKAYLNLGGSLISFGDDSHPDFLGQAPGATTYAPVRIGDTVYLVTYTTEYSEPDYNESYHTYVTVINPDGATIADPLTSGLSGKPVGTIVAVGETNYLVTTGVDPSTSDERTYIYMIARDGSATPVDLGPNGIPGTSSYMPLVVGDHAYVFTYVPDGPNSYHTDVTVIGPDGTITPPDPGADVIPGYASGDPIAAGDNIYLATRVDLGGGQYRTYVTVIAPDGSYTAPDPVADAIPGFRNYVTVAGDTAYLVTSIGSFNDGINYVTAVGPDGYTPPTIPTPGQTIGKVAVVGDKAYLITYTSVWDPVTQTGTGTTYLTTVKSDGTYAAPAAFAGTPQGLPVIIGDTVYLSTDRGLYAIGTVPPPPVPPVEL